MNEPSCSASARATPAHLHGSAPDKPARSMIFQPVPPQMGHTAVAAMRTPTQHIYSTTTSLFNDYQNLACSHRSIRPRTNFRHASGLGRLHFILHLHRLHDNEALPFFYGVTGRH